MLILYNLLYLCLALLLEAKWILLKTKAFAQTEITCTKVKYAEPYPLWEEK